MPFDRRRRKPREHDRGNDHRNRTDGNQHYANAWITSVKRHTAQKKSPGKKHGRADQAPGDQRSVARGHLWCHANTQTEDEVDNRQ
jgi:hypothetical protein